MPEPATEPELASTPHGDSDATVHFSGGASYRFVPLSTWDSVLFRKEFGVPLEGMDKLQDDDAHRAGLWLAWRSAVNGGASVDFEGFLRSIPLLPGDVRRLRDATAAFFTEPATEAEA